MIRLLILFITLTTTSTAFATKTCNGRFINPITDVCWSCLLPISIGSWSFGKGGSIKNRDIPNPANPLCTCTKANVPIPGVSVGFWEPVRLIDVTRTPYCMTNLGGLMVGPSESKKVSSYSRRYDNRSHHSFYHLHYYIYPLIYWLELITDFICLEQTTFDVAYMSELDVTWNDEKLQSVFNPEAALFGSLPAQAACMFDCVKANFDVASDKLFWCAGCYGNMYPFSGANADHVGGVQNSSLLSTRILAKMHRIGFAQETSTTDGSINGKLCRKSLSPLIKKSQYKLQMTYPKSTNGNLGCWPLGLSDLLYSSFKEFPNEGQDWGYLVWRKRNCCAF